MVQSETGVRSELLGCIKSLGVRRLDEPVVLSCGALSHDFIDLKQVWSVWSNLLMASKVVVDVVEGNGVEFDVVGGMTMGADPVALGVAYVREGAHWFSVHETVDGLVVEGARLERGMRALLVDDVTTSGRSLLRAWEAVTAGGAEVAAGVAVVDRGLSVRGEFERRGAPFLPVFTFESLGIEPVSLGRG